MATVVMNGVTFNSDDFADYGYLNSTQGLFAAWTAMVAELASSTSLAGLAPAGEHRFIYAPTSTAFISADIATNTQIVYASHYFG